MADQFLKSPKKRKLVKFERDNQSGALLLSWRSLSPYSSEEEHKFPKLDAQVRLLLRAPSNICPRNLTERSRSSKPAYVGSNPTVGAKFTPL